MPFLRRRKVPPVSLPPRLTEDEIKRAIAEFLLSEGYEIRNVAWGHTRGVDIEAAGPGGRLLIEVKGDAQTPQMQGNYFLGALGELLQRMDDANAIYAVGLPDNARFRGLVARFPDEARRRLGLWWIFVRRDTVRGGVVEYVVEALHPPT